MKRNLASVVWVICIIVFLGTSSLALAENALVLPKGASRLSVKGTFWSTVQNRYDPNGDLESVASYFNAEVNENIFPGIIPAGQNIGTTVVDFEYQRDDMELQYQYGITDRLSFGVKIPYLWQKTNLKEARVDTSDATLVIVPGNPPTLAPCGTAGLNCGDPTTDAIATQFVLAAVEAPPYSYEPFESWSGQGIGDIEAGARYQYLNSDAWRLAFTGGVRFPTGEFDNQDNLLDLTFGSGAYALLFNFNNDFKGIKNLLLNATVKYDLYLPDEETMRVLFSVDRPLAPIANKEKVDRNLGDIFRLELSGQYSLSKTFHAGLVYEYADKQRDKVSGSNPTLNYNSLENETDQTSHVYKVYLAYSTGPLFMEKKFAVPLDVILTYRDRFAGTNKVFDAQNISLEVALYF